MTAEYSHIDEISKPEAKELILDLKQPETLLTETDLLF